MNKNDSDFEFKNEIDDEEFDTDSQDINNDEEQKNEEQDNEEINDTIDKTDEESIDEKRERLINKNLINEELETEKKSNKVLIIICIILLVIICLLIYFLLIKDNKNNENNDVQPKPTENKIVRPSNNIEYITLNQNYFGFNCNKDNKNNKLESIKKGSIVKCEFNFDLSYNVSELYFDIDNSSNIKFLKYSNDSDYSLIDDNHKTFKLTTSNPVNKQSEKIYFFFEVLSDNEKTGYVEINNVIFKDDKDKYYKVLNKISSFPPEKTNKIYIYESTDFENKKYYSAYKVKKEDETIFDTFTCKNEDCEVLTNADINFLIKDDSLIVYNINNKAKETINNFDITKYSNYNYEIMLNKDADAYGVIFYGEYKDNKDCSLFEDFCIEKALSGSEVGYYSFKENNFTIALDYGFIGVNIYSDNHDRGLLLMKNDKYGFYSYETDNLILNMTNKYTNIDYDSNINAILLENKDKNGEYYYTFMDINGKEFIPNKEDLNELKGTNLYYISYKNRNGKEVYYLFDKNLKQLSIIKYVLQKDIISTEGKLIIKPNDLYEIYDVDGNKLYITKFEQKDIYYKGNNYLIVNSNDNIELYDLNNNPIVGITPILVDTKFIKSEENEDKTISIYIIEKTENENTNGNKYIVNLKTKDYTKEEVLIEN